MSILLGDPSFTALTCGLTEEGKNVTLMYTIADPADHITWEWTHQETEDGSHQHTAVMTAHDSKRGHRSQPVPDDVYKKLGSPKKTKEDAYFKVKMKRKENVSVEKYFNS
ncbi:uncharacterized protein [Littorina saxatilis]|uniref:uncharacterized protein n=1 Tax=Littorina saxatilis TaxID=31220 RepID=UPI0038B60CF0